MRRRRERFAPFAASRTAALDLRASAARGAVVVRLRARIAACTLGSGPGGARGPLLRGGCVRANMQAYLSRGTGRGTGGYEVEIGSRSGGVDSR